MRPSFSPLFSFLFFFKKGKKAGEKAGGCVNELLFPPFLFCFLFLKKAKEEQREENFLLALFLFF